MTEEENTASLYFNNKIEGEVKKKENKKENQKNQKRIRKTTIKMSGPHSDSHVSRMGEIFATSTMMDVR